MLRPGDNSKYYPGYSITFVINGQEYLFEKWETFIETTDADRELLHHLWAEDEHYKYHWALTQDYEYVVNRSSGELVVEIRPIVPKRIVAALVEHKNNFTYIGH